MKATICSLIILCSFLSCASSREPTWYPLKTDPFIVKGEKIIDILSGYRLETTELSYRYYTDTWRNLIRLNWWTHYSYDKSYKNLTGIKYEIHIDYPHNYIGEDRGSYESHKAVYYYIQESANNEFGEGFRFDNRKVNDLDALHLSCAINAKVDYFITVDNGILKYNADKMLILDPLEFIKHWENLEGQND